MENKPTTLPIKNFRDVKTYSLAWFKIHEELSYSQVYLIDKKERKIWMYEMNRKAKDTTRHSQRLYESNLQKDFLNRKIGGELFKLMDSHDDCPHHLHIFAHTDSAKEMTDLLYEVRALQAEHYLRICHNHCHWTTEEAAAQYLHEI